MALHPDVQAKCQAEIRDEIGSRPPTMDDLSKLTYALATLNEIQRLSVVAPGSLAHVLTKDSLCARVRGCSCACVNERTNE